MCLTWHNVAGDQLLIPSEMDTDLEQLIKGGPFELSLAADRLGNDLFGINSGAQVRLTHVLEGGPAVDVSTDSNAFLGIVLFLTKHSCLLSDSIKVVYKIHKQLIDVSKDC